MLALAEAGTIVVGKIVAGTAVVCVVMAGIIREDIGIIREDITRHGTVVAGTATAARTESGTIDPH
jgi:hypothetical protein